MLLDIKKMDKNGKTGLTSVNCCDSRTDASVAAVAGVVTDAPRLFENSA